MEDLGTTWVTDVICRSLGIILYFEPFHPDVCKFNFSYKSLPNAESHIDNLKVYIDSLMANHIENKWLLRNHLPYDIDKIQPEFVNNMFKYITKYSLTKGFSEIRANHMIKWLKETYPSSKIIFIIRSPFQVISSILNRNFWEYNSFETTFNIWNKNGKFGLEEITSKKSIFEKIELISIMWKMSNEAALQTLNNLNIPFFKYEELYTNPLEKFHDIFRYLETSSKIHPMNIFTPSITTNKTMHGLRSIDFKLFYKDILSVEMIEIIKSIVKDFKFDIYNLEEV